MKVEYFSFTWKKFEVVEKQYVAHSQGAILDEVTKEYSEELYDLEFFYCQG